MINPKIFRENTFFFNGFLGEGIRDRRKDTYCKDCKVFVEFSDKLVCLHVPQTVEDRARQLDDNHYRKIHFDKLECDSGIGF